MDFTGRLCSGCALEITKDNPGVSCAVCSKPYHKACLAGKTRESKSGVCPKCEAAAGAEGQRQSLALGLERMGFDSTGVPHSGQMNQVDPRVQSQLDEMRQMMLDMKQLMLESAGRRAETGSAAAGLEQVVEEHNEANRSEDNSRTRSMNKTQAAIVASIRSAPVSKTEMEHRRRRAELPRFGGDPTTWFMFYSIFTETTAQCGYSNSENMQRLKEALVEPARGRVAHYFEMPHRLPELMGELEELYGNPEILMKHVLKTVGKIPSLRTDLANCTTFYGEVMKIGDAIEMMDEPTEFPGLTDSLVRKMCVQQRLDWLKYLGTEKGTVPRFQAYIGNLCGSLKRVLDDEDRGEMDNGVRTGAKPKVARVMLQEEKNKGIAKEDMRSRCAIGCPTAHELDFCPKFKRMSPRERWQFVKRTGRCAFCFDRHYVHNCARAVQCPRPGCEHKHHTLLHREDQAVHRNERGNMQPRPGHSRAGEPSVSAPPDAFIGVAKQAKGGAVYGVAQVVLSHNGRQITTYALMDTGSCKTFMRTDLARKLGLAGKRDTMIVAWTDTKRHPIVTERVQVSLRGEGGSAHQIEVQTMDDLALPLYTLTGATIAAEGFADLPLQCAGKIVPQLLLGLDQAKLIVSKEMRLGKNRQLVAARTQLGWVVMGVRGQSEETRCLFVKHDEDELHQLVEQLIEADQFPMVEAQVTRRLSDEDERAMQLMEQRTQFTGKRYETGLLWRRDNVTLPDNRDAAAKRHQSLVRRLKKDPQLWQRVDEMVADYVQKGYAREVREYAEERPPREWFLPVFVVQNPNKPDKVRLVMDGAAECHGVSLNSQLLTGPDLNATLLQVLLRFRLGEVAVSGDIKEMFHQVAIRPEDRSSQRIMWQGVRDTQPRVYEMLVMVFGAACSPTLAQYVKNRNADESGESHAVAIEAIKQRHYVDDYLDSRATAEEVLEVAKMVKKIHQRGGFVIHKFASNHAEVTRALGEEEPSIVEVSTIGTLGLNWNTSNDCLSFRWRADKYEDLMRSEKMPTKRQLLRMAMSVFDPLGLIAYITVIAMILLREAWRSETGWDESIPETGRRMWKQWLQILATINDQPIPRWYGQLGEDVELHVFVDASEAAIGAVVYAVKPRPQGGSIVALVMAKCKVAPLRTKSIPRLELDAAVLGVRVLQTVRAAKCWNQTTTHMWSDARDVLYWLRSHKRRYSSYVANRVGTILRHTAVEEWRWTPTDQNPADWATKYSERPSVDTLWRQGPAFLQQPRATWPDSDQPPATILEEVRVLVVAPTIARNPRIPPYEQFSTWERLIRNVACVQRMIDLAKRRASRGAITAEELSAAEHIILKDMQQHLTEREKNRLSAYEDDQGTWRMRSRLARAPQMPHEEKFPIVLPRDHPGTRLIMDWYHRVGEHCLDQRAMYEFRRRFVVIHQRRISNAVIKTCGVCALQRARPAAPEMAALPEGRVAINRRAFAFTGTDVFGPITITIGRRKEKRWGIIFTCLTTRAVYLDIVQSLSARSCMMAMDGLAARRGGPIQYHSDNGTNFVAAAKQYVDPDGRRPRWVFNAPHAPHTGGAWERMIGVTKKALTKMGLEEEPTEERLRWLLSKAEFLINSRPLVELAGVHEEVLTPNDILIGRGERKAALEVTREQSSGADFMAVQEDRVQHFWKWWSSAYVPTIAARSKWRTKQESLEVDDVVYLCDGDYRRGWRKGRVMKVFVDEEAQQVREVTVVTGDGSVYRRHVAKVAPVAKGPGASCSKGEC